MENQHVSEREAAITRTEVWILAAHPALDGVVRPFASLFRARARVAGKLAAQAADLNFPALLVSKGLQRLSDAAFPAEASLLAARGMLEAARKRFPALETPLSDLARGLNRTDMAALHHAFLTHASKAVEDAAVDLDVPSDCLELVVRLSLSALLMGLADGRGPDAVPGVQAKGHCPVCGSLPAISFLDLPSSSQSEFLTGGGGRRFFHCSLCGHDWPARRMVCPACETGNPEDLRYYQPDEESGQRVDVCKNCKTYLPCLDLRTAAVSDPDMDLAAVGMVHLDVLAQEKGYVPLAYTLWNRMG